MNVRDISPDAVVDALLAAGWQMVGERAGLYKRLAVAGGRPGARLGLMVPLDPSMADFDDLMNEVLETLETLLIDGQSAQQVLNRIQPGVYQ